MRHPEQHTALKAVTATACLALGTLAPAFADTPPAAPVAPEPPVAPVEPVAPAPEVLHRYEAALEAAEAEQRAALEAMEAARAELVVRARERERMAEKAREHRLSEAEVHRAAAEARAVERRELSQVQRELERAHENLRRASREVSRVHREINRPTNRVVEYRFSSDDDTDRAVIGVILGGNTTDGVKILGVSPDGPAERAGIQPGDVITAVMGQRLAGGSEPPQAVLSDAVKDIEVGDSIDVTVLRDGNPESLTVVASKREPFTWHSWSSLAAAPVDGERQQILVERINMPEIDQQALEAQVDALRERMEQGELTYAGPNAWAFSESGGDWEFEFQEFSDFGDAVIAGTNIWFGMPLTRGLKMAELDPGLGRYFDADKGVLVLEASPDNGLQLQPGDVILKVADQAVSTPADVMRALRDVESGSVLNIEIKRDQANHILEVPLPEERLGLLWHD
ncbi:PDZ domain-containing protein [Marinihelvus fidelis]|uniref:PDZ domain-containing protein n=1 Tax=Marinihelvus fidelis TaxID=2613842 RepID=A0A5N0TB69_9GAMM|nr:PDZ domain-containing protein [Marinihelvus fidelis]KAA9131918.1 PDZ domain-containing protein [Marinihelvus fidelis]